MAKKKAKKPDDLDEILADLEQGGPSGDVPLVEPVSAEPEPPVAAAPAAGELRPQVIRKSDAIVSRVDPVAAAAEMLSSIKDEFGEISDEIMGSWRRDRGQTQEVIDILKKELEDAIEGGVETPRVYVEALAKLVEAKVNSSVVGVKLLDSKIKLLQALKGGAGTQLNIFNQNGSGAGTDQDLVSMLSEPLPSDFPDGD